MIKKYIDFIKESREDYDVPSHFVELNSIGYYLDPIEGKIYAMLKNGGYELEPYDVEDDMENLSDDERRLVDSFKISTEDLIGDKINLDLMEDIIDKCISEGLVDEKDVLDIKIQALVRSEESYKSIIAYTIRTPKEDEEDKIIHNWYELFKEKADILRKKTEEDIYYVCIFTCIKRYEETLKPKMDAVERFIKGGFIEDESGEKIEIPAAYPDEQCDFLSTFWTSIR